MDIQSFNHICIQTSTYEASFRFYTELLGFQIVEEGSTPKRLHKTLLRLNHLTIELISEKPDKPFSGYDGSAQGMVHLSFKVKNIEDSFEEASKHEYVQFKGRHGKNIYKAGKGKQFKLVAPEGTEIVIKDH